MSEIGSNLLSKSSVNSPSSKTKSPFKNTIQNPTINSTPIHQKTPSSSWKEWKPNVTVETIPSKGPQTNVTLRQTFDTRTNARIQEKLAYYEKNLEEKGKEESHVHPTLRQTIQTVLPSPNKNILMESTAVETVQRKPEEKYLEVNMQEIKNRNHRKSYNLDKFKSYMDYVDKFKDELETTKKVSEEIQKLK